jgi:hypothetical protein
MRIKSFLLFASRWNITVTIDESSPNPPWVPSTVRLAATPEHVVKVNGVVVYHSQKATPQIPTSNDAWHIFNCLTSTALQVTGSGPEVYVPPN